MKTIRALLAIIVLASPLAANADVIVLDATKDGRNGCASAMPWSLANNYSNDFCTGFRAFDLSTVVGTITAATLRLPATSSVSAVSGALVTLYDVSTPVAFLGTNDGPGDAAIRTDLRSGTVYGGFNYVKGIVNVVNLNASAIADLNAAIGGEWAVGVEAPGNSFTGAFGFNSPGGSQLVLTTRMGNVPVTEPGTLGMLGLGLLAVGFARRRRKN